MAVKMKINDGNRERERERNDWRERVYKKDIEV